MQNGSRAPAIIATDPTDKRSRRRGTLIAYTTVAMTMRAIAITATGDGDAG